MRHLSLALFGGFQAAINDRPIRNFGSDKARALLAYLAIEKAHPHRRSTLEGMFWPDQPEKKAAHNLSQTLLRIRIALEDGRFGSDRDSVPFLRIECQDVQLNWQNSIYSDVDTFSRLVKACRQHHAGNPAEVLLCPDCMLRLKEAASVYSGELLEGIQVRNCPPFEQWRLVQQETLRRQAAEVLGTLADYHERRGEYDPMQSYAQQLIRLDAWNENGHQKLMRALAAKGQSAAAMQHFAEFRKAMAAELGSEPGQATLNLYQQIRLGEVLPAAEPSPAELNLLSSGQAELRQITALVCYRCVTSPLLDPEQDYQQMRGCRQNCTQILQRFGGHLSTRQGNVCLVYFGYPSACEDSAAHAVRAGLAMATADPTNPVRISIHTGWMVIGEKHGRRSQDRELVGSTPSVARNFLTYVPPGRVVISGDTERLVRGQFQYSGDPLPYELEMGGVLPLYRIQAEQRQARLFPWAAHPSALSPFVGREQEKEMLCSSLRKAAAGEGQVVIVRGEAGIGKSRLIWELKQHCDRQPAMSPHPLWLVTHCTQYGQANSYSSLVDLIYQLLGVDPEAPITERKEKTEAALQQDLPDDPAGLKVLSFLLRYPEQDTHTLQTTNELRDLILNAALRLLKKRLESTPIVLVVEDLQWSNAEIRHWITRMQEELSDQRCLLLLTTRANSEPSWLGKQNLTRLEVGPLDPALTGKLADEIAAGGLAADMLQKVVERSDGVPLYVEELVRAQQETGERPGPESIPPALRDLLAASLDALGPAKLVAQWSAVAGRLFSLPLIQQATQMKPERLRQHIETLQSAGVIMPVGDPQQEEYTFRQALMQEAAAGSLLRTLRQEYEQRVDQARQQVSPASAS